MLRFVIGGEKFRCCPVPMGVLRDAKLPKPSEEDEDVSSVPREIG